MPQTATLIIPIRCKEKGCNGIMQCTEEKRDEKGTLKSILTCSKCGAKAED